MGILGTFFSYKVSIFSKAVVQMSWEKSKVRQKAVDSISNNKLSANLKTAGKSDVALRTIARLHFALYKCLILRIDSRSLDFRKFV